MTSTLTRPERPAAVVDGIEAPEGISIAELSVHANGTFTNERMAMLLADVSPGDIWRVLGNFHLTFDDLTRVVIPKLRQLDGLDCKNPTSKRERNICVALGLQELLRKRLGGRKITDNGTQVQVIIRRAIFDHLEKCDAAKKQALANRLVRVDLNPPPLDLLLLAEAVIADNARAAKAQETAARAAIETRYAKVLCTLFHPTSEDAKELAYLMKELKITREAIADDLAAIHQVIKVTAEWIAADAALKKLDASIPRSDVDRNCKIVDTKEYKNERRHRGTLNSIRTSHPTWFTPGTWPPCLRYPPASEESTAKPHAQA